MDRFRFRLWKIYLFWSEESSFADTEISKFLDNLIIKNITKLFSNCCSWLAEVVNIPNKLFGNNDIHIHLEGSQKRVPYNLVVLIKIYGITYAIVMIQPLQISIQ